MSTQVKPCPKGELPAFIKAVALRDFTYKKGERAGMTGYAMDISWQVTDHKVEQELGFQPTVRQSFILDFKEGSNALDSGEGKNTGLGRIREAVRQNQEGQAWSPKMLEGATAIILVDHRIDGENIYADVIRVRAA